MSYYQPPPPSGTPYDPNYGQNAAPSTTSQSPLTEFLTLASKGTRTRDWPTWMYRPEAESRAKQEQVLSMLTGPGSSSLSPELQAALRPIRRSAQADISRDYLSGDPQAQMNNIYRTLSSPYMKGILEKAIGASGPATTTDPNFTPPPPAGSAGGGGLLDVLRASGVEQPFRPSPYAPQAPAQAPAPGRPQGLLPAGVGVGGPAGMQGLLQMLMQLFQGGGMNNQQTPRMW